MQELFYRQLCHGNLALTHQVLERVENVKIFYEPLFFKTIIFLITEHLKQKEEEENYIILEDKEFLTFRKKGKRFLLQILNS